jgi:CTD small phosphatase-like protein 2
MEKMTTQYTESNSSPLKVSNPFKKRNTISVVKNTNALIGSLRCNDSPLHPPQVKSKSFHFNVHKTKQPLTSICSTPDIEFPDTKIAESGIIFNQFTQHFTQIHTQLHNFYSLGILPPSKECIEKLLNHKPKPTHKANMKTLAFGVDNTLIMCRNSNFPDSIEVCIGADPTNTIKGYIKVRPFVVEGLQELSKYFEIMIFTAGSEEYAKAISKYLDPTSTAIDYIFGREQCIEIKEYELFVKDLRVLNRDLANVILVDDTALSFIFQLENGIPIYPYIGDSDDTHFKSIYQYLASLKDTPCLKDTVSVKYRLNDLYSCSLLKLPGMIDYYFTNVNI